MFGRLSHSRTSIHTFLALMCVFILISTAIALNVVNTHTFSGVINTPFSITTAGSYKHTVWADNNSEIQSGVENGGQPLDGISADSGSCATHTFLNLPVGSLYYLVSNAQVANGESAKACVYSPQVVPCCPSGGGGCQEQ